jgi:hypothetical protein
MVYNLELIINYFPANYWQFELEMEKKEFYDLI